MFSSLLVALGIAAAWGIQRYASESARPDLASTVEGEQGARPSAPSLRKVAEQAKKFGATDLLPVSPDSAQEINAARPFVGTRDFFAAPYRARLADADRERALACLAVAALYEAGGDPDDQRPVIQVILNRARHPAWPNSVCEVVFQGSERSIDCQFTFTCDGSMNRWRPSARALKNAREVADKMLSGRVDPRVGLSTHYHTDWVVPYWSASLDKIAAVKTHLFFSWKGVWGRPPAFRAAASPSEPRIAQLAAFDSSHAPAEDPVGADDKMPPAQEDSSSSIASAADSRASPPRAAEPKVMPLAAGSRPGRWALDAVSRCGGKPECRVIGWVDPKRRPAIIDRATLKAAPPDFVYVQVLRERTQQAYWNCRKWPPAGTSRCLGSPSAAAALAFAEL